MTRLALVILGLALGSVQADFMVSAKANVVTPDQRPAEGCAVALADSSGPPREKNWWWDFRGHFIQGQLTSSYRPLYVHVRCKGWRPVVRRLFFRVGRGWSSDSATFVLRGPVDLGTITLQPSR